MLVAKNIEDDVPFKGEGIVTPCFPQLVNITELAKNYGKLINVNNLMNFIAGLLRGDVQKRDHDGGGRHLKRWH